MGMGSFRRHATAAEVEKMKANLKSELEKGSLGLCTGLEYERAFYSNRDEVLALAKVAGEAGGRYMSHIRSEDINIEDAIDEIIHIGREAKLPVQVSHIKVAMKSKWESSRGIIAAMQAARAEGIDITADCYPYDFWLLHAQSAVPQPRLRQPRQPPNLPASELFDPAQSKLPAFLPNPAYKGKNRSRSGPLAQRKRPAQTLVWLIAEADRYDGRTPRSRGQDGGASWASPCSKRTSPTSSPGRTPISAADGDPWSHPRGHGAFPRVLAKYVRDQKLLSLETAIQKMSALSAEHTGIRQRGLVSNGFYADLVLFDPATVQDNATADKPTALSNGITAVWVNGQLVFENGKATGKLPGVLVRR
jgi:N-acyl-D-amino-acid deacylase